MEQLQVVESEGLTPHCTRQQAGKPRATSSRQLAQCASEPLSPPHPPHPPQPPHPPHPPNSPPQRLRRPKLPAHFILRGAHRRARGAGAGDRRDEGRGGKFRKFPRSFRPPSIACSSSSSSSSSSIVGASAGHTPTPAPAPHLHAATATPTTPLTHPQVLGVRAVAFVNSFVVFTVSGLTLRTAELKGLLKGVPPRRGTTSVCLHAAHHAPLRHQPLPVCNLSHPAAPTPAPHDSRLTHLHATQRTKPGTPDRPQRSRHGLWPRLDFGDHAAAGLGAAGAAV